MKEPYLKSLANFLQQSSNHLVFLRLRFAFTGTRKESRLVTPQYYFSHCIFYLVRLRQRRGRRRCRGRGRRGRLRRRSGDGKCGSGGRRRLQDGCKGLISTLAQERRQGVAQETQEGGNCVSVLVQGLDLVGFAVKSNL